MSVSAHGSPAAPKPIVHRADEPRCESMPSRLLGALTAGALSRQRRVGPCLRVGYAPTVVDSVPMVCIFITMVVDKGRSGRPGEPSGTSPASAGGPDGR